MNDTANDDDQLELAPISPSPRRTIPPAAPVPNQPGSPADSPRPAPLEYRVRPPNAPAGADTETIKNLYLPMWILAGGVLIEVIAAYVSAPDAAAAISSLGINLVLNTLFLLVALLIAFKLRGIELGNFSTAIFKLLALSVAPPAAATVLNLPLSHIFLGWLIGFAVVFVLSFALLGALFDLDESQTWYCIAVIFIAEVVVHFIGYFFLRG